MASPLAQRVSEVPDAFEHSNCSTVVLLKEAGYLDQPQSLKVEDVEEVLAQEPALTELWLERAHDQRLTGGWGLECAQGRYRVVCYANGQNVMAEDRQHATAEFIVRYVGFIAEVLRRYSH
jgi:hypothetical protein